MPTPKLSLIVPAKDCAHFLPTMFSSLTEQLNNLDDLQVIFIDDGSTDETPNVVSAFGEKFPHFEVITNHTAVGLANGRNMGIERAAGEYIAFLDGDDWLAPGHLQTMLESIEALGVDFVRCDHTTVQGNARHLRRAPMAVRNRPLNPRMGILPVHDSTMVDYPYAWAGIFHRRLADNGMLFFPKNFMTAEDRSWIWNLHLNSTSFAVVDSPGILYRRGLVGSLTQILDDRQLMFADAFNNIFTLVEADKEVVHWWPKATRNWLAILHHQADRFTDNANFSLLKKFHHRCVETSSRIPQEILLTQLAQANSARQIAVLPHLGISRSILGGITV